MVVAKISSGIWRDGRVGLRRTTGNRVYPNRYQGFESLSLRQKAPQIEVLFYFILPLPNIYFFQAGAYRCIRFFYMEFIIQLHKMILMIFNYMFKNPISVQNKHTRKTLY